MEITGKVTAVLPLETGETRAGKEWKKQSFILEYQDGEYSKQVCIKCFGKTVEHVPNVGDDASVLLSIESREYNGKWYTDANAFRIKSSRQERVAYDSEKPSNDLPF